MKPETQAIAKEFERRLREARREVWRTVVGTNEELTTLEQQARASSEEAGTMAVTGVLARLDTAERRLLDEIDAARGAARGRHLRRMRAMRKVDPARPIARAARRAPVCRVRARRRARGSRLAGTGRCLARRSSSTGRRAVPAEPGRLRARAGVVLLGGRARPSSTGLPGGRGLNIAHEAVDRHAAGPRRDRVALRWLGKTGAVRDFTYGDLRELTNRFANVLDGLGVARGDRVFALAGRIPELYVAALGTLKHGGVFCPLFSAFGPGADPAAHGDRRRARARDDRVALPPQGRGAARARCPTLEHVLLVGDAGAADRVPGTHDFARARWPRRPIAYVIGPTAPEDMALLHFTSGTTGTPKGAIHVHEAVVAHHVTGRFALDLHPDDVFWCTADPGWVTGTSYGIIAPLTHGVTSIVDEARLRRRALVPHPAGRSGSPSGTRRRPRSAC